MSTQLRLRRGTTAQTSTFTGVTGEVTVDTSKNTIVVHDGVTLGGHPIATEIALQAAFDKANSAATIDEANLIFDLSNTVAEMTNVALITANAAFDKANSVAITTQEVFDKANTNAGSITVLQAVTDTQNTIISNTLTHSQFAYNQANTATNNAASASLYANTGINNAASASLYANVGITLAQASFDTANLAYSQANTATNNAESASLYANTGITLAQAAFDKANTGTTGSEDSWARSAVNSASLYANTDYTTINTTEGTYGGATQIPVIVLAANGRVSSITNTSINGGATITDDTSTNGVRYVMLGTATSGSYSTANTSSTKLFFNPSSGSLSTTSVNVTSLFTTANGSTGTAGQVLTSSGSGVYWATAAGGAGGGLTTTDDTSTDAPYYPVVVTSAGGSTAKTSSTKFTFNPSTGTLGATIFNSLSDENVKNNIQKIENASAIINQIDGVEFNWKDNGKKSAGTIAQQLEKILPHLVEETNGVKSVNYSGLIAYLIESNKELQKRIELLESK